MNIFALRQVEKLAEDKRVSSLSGIICSPLCNYEPSSVSSRHRHRKHWLRAATFCKWPGQACARLPGHTSVPPHNGYHRGASIVTRHASHGSFRTLSLGLQHTKLFRCSHRIKMKSGVHPLKFNNTAGFISLLLLPLINICPQMMAFTHYQGKEKYGKY